MTFRKVTYAYAKEKMANFSAPYTYVSQKVRNTFRNRPITVLMP